MEFFIAKRLARFNTGSFSSIIIRIAILAVAISVAILILTASIVEGFQSNITKKIFGYWGHIQVLHYTSDRALEGIPIMNDPILKDTILGHENVKSIHPFAQKAGILKTKEEIEGIILKGVDHTFDWSYMEESLDKGSVLTFSDSVPSRGILISRSIANRLNIKINDAVLVFFIKESSVNTIYRKMKVKGIYHTGLEEYDRLFCIVDIRHIQKLNNWNDLQVAGYEVFLKDVNKLDSSTEKVENSMPYMYRALSLKEVFPNIFDWINLTITNKYIVVILVTLVAAFNMVTVLLILILERTKMVGLLKALGANDWAVQKVFLYHAFLIIAIGMILGNILGIGLSLLQEHFHFDL
ncbi:MAG TPA: ABC transporter permease [Bacteroidetes bacterium]|nr:ABC transporter permease [Bacteroidota bacterium]